MLQKGKRLGEIEGEREETGREEGMYVATPSYLRRQQNAIVRSLKRKRQAASVHTDMERR